MREMWRNLALLASTACALTAQDLRVEYMSNPLAIDNPFPRFQWQLNGTTAQTGYEIFVATDPSLSPSTIVWDSFQRNGNATSQIVYDGAQLQSDTDYYWLVSVQGSDSSWTNSSVATFTAGLLNSADWAGSSYIGGYNQLRGTLRLASASGVTRARVYITGVGCYQLWLNGYPVEEDGAGRRTIANPGFSTIFTSRLLYNAFDVAHKLAGSGATNVFGIRLGSCKYGYLGEFATEPTPYTPGGKAQVSPGLAALMHVSITQQDGTHTVWGTSTATGSWLGVQSPIVSDHFYNGEVYDLRMDLHASSPLAGWSTAAYVPTPQAGWGAVQAMPSPTAQLSAYAMPQITGWEESGMRYADSVVQVTGGETLAPGTTSWAWDFGINQGAWFELTVRGPMPADTVLNLKFAEQTAASGLSAGVLVGFSCPNACCQDGGNCANQSYSFILPELASDETVTLKPTFAYVGFRYAQVLGWPSDVPGPVASDLTLTATSSGVEVAGHVAFNGSTAVGKLLNSLQDAIVRSQRSNLASIPTDCPQREKRGWMADAHVSSEESNLNLYAPAVYENWLRTHADTGTIGCGNLTANWTCPKWSNSQPGSADVSPSGDGWWVASADDDPVDASRGNCYICCYGRPGFGCTPRTPTNTTGSISDVIPFDKNGYGSFPGSLCWTAASFIVAEVLFRRYANIQAQGSWYEQFKAQLLYYNWNSNTNNPSTGLVIFENYGDWNAVDSSTSKVYLANVYYEWSALIMGEIAASLGPSHVNDALSFLVLAAAINDELVPAFFTRSKGYWDSGSQSGQAAALYFGLGANETANMTASVVQQLVHDVTVTHDNHLSVGTIGSRYLLQALSQSGRGDVALALVNQTSSPGWGSFIAGIPGFPPLGTFWEGWDGYHDGSSGNHVMFAGGLGEWFYSYALGLRVGHAYVPHGAQQEAAARAAEACTRTLGLQWNLQQRMGLSDAHICTAARVLQDIRALRAAGGTAGGLYAWEAISSKVAQRVRAAPIVSTQPAASFLPYAHLVLDPHMLSGLGFAHGWLRTSSGAVRAAWTHSAAQGRTEVQLTLPPNIPGKLYLPLTLFASTTAQGAIAGVTSTVHVELFAQHATGGTGGEGGTGEKGVQYTVTAQGGGGHRVHQQQEGSAGVGVQWSWSCAGESEGRLPALPCTHLHTPTSVSSGGQGMQHMVLTLGTPGEWRVTVQRQQ